MADGQASRVIFASTAATGILLLRYRRKSWVVYYRKVIGCTLNAKKRHSSEEINAEGNIKTQSGWLITQHVKGWLNEAHGGGLYMDDNYWIRSVNNKVIYTDGQLKGGTIRADGRLSTGEFLHLDEKMRYNPAGDAALTDW